MSNTSAYDTHIAAVAASNQKVGAFPIVTLADGSKAPTGTIATLLHNIRLYNTLKSKDDAALGDEEGKQVAQIEQEMRAAVPVLLKVGLMDLFSPEEWIKGGSAGRRFVGEVAKELGGH